MFEPITDTEVKELGRRLDSLIIAADSQEQMMRKLNTLRSNGSPNWHLLCMPWWVGKQIVAVVLKPRI